MILNPRSLREVLEEIRAARAESINSVMVFENLNHKAHDYGLYPLLRGNLVYHIHEYSAYSEYFPPVPMKIRAVIGMILQKYPSEHFLHLSPGLVDVGESHAKHYLVHKEGGKSILEWRDVDERVEGEEAA